MSERLESLYREEVSSLSFAHPRNYFSAESLASIGLGCQQLSSLPTETGGEDDGIGQYDANNNSLVWKTFSLSGHSKCRIYATLQQTAFRITCGKSTVSLLENRE